MIAASVSVQGVPLVPVAGSSAIGSGVTPGSAGASGVPGVGVAVGGVRTGVPAVGASAGAPGKPGTVGLPVRITVAATMRIPPSGARPSRTIVCGPGGRSGTVNVSLATPSRSANPMPSTTGSEYIFPVNALPSS